MRRFSKGEEARGAGCERVKHGGGVMSQPCVPPSFHSPPCLIDGAGMEVAVDDVVMVVCTEGAATVALVIDSTSPQLASPTSAKHHQCY